MGSSSSKNEYSSYPYCRAVNFFVENWFSFLFHSLAGGYAIWTIVYMQNVPIHLDFRGKHISGVADPIQSFKDESVPTTHSIYLEGKFVGTLKCENKGWVMDRPTDLELVETLGEYLHAWYE